MTPENTLVLAAAGDRQAREQAADILLRGLAIYLRLAGEVSLERCCGLPGPTAKKRIAQLQRDFYLARAYQFCTAKNRAEQLAAEVSDFTSRIYPAWSGMAEPPPTASALRSELFWAYQADPKDFPTSSRQLRRIVDSTETTTQSTFQMKTLAVIESEARSEYAASPGLHAEFSNVAAYVAFRKAESEGRISWFTKSPDDVSSLPGDKF